MKAATKRALKKFTSRKFLTSLGTEVGLLTAVFFPKTYGDTLTEIIVRAGAIVGMILIALGYIKTEGDIDKEGVKREATKEGDNTN